MKFLHVTDPHIIPEGALCGSDPAARLRACIADINAHHADAAAVVVTGDLTDTGDDASYARLAAILADLTPPAHLLIGNHDRRGAFRAAFPETPVDGDGFVQYGLDTPAGRFLCLDTVDEGHHHGRLGPARLAWLEAELDGAQGSPVFLFMHHAPLPVGHALLDGIGLLDADDLAAVVSRRTNIRQIFFGHLHRPVCGHWRGIPFAGLPSLNHQTALDLTGSDVWIGAYEPPAYAVVLAQPDATVVHFHNFIDGAKTFPY
jgi:3',5'-cyclic AMP phosphodiesterase CpdA